jgi:hypothetical protein
MASERKPPEYWEDFSNLEHELLAFIEEHGTPRVMPKQDELIKARRSNLSNAIRQHGGFQSVAEKLGWDYTRKRPDHWKEFDNVARELLAFIEKQGTPGVMPTKKALEKAGYSNLANAIEKNHGGYWSVAQKLSLICTKKNSEVAGRNLIM